MIVHDSWWSNGSARSTIINYHALFDLGLIVEYTLFNTRSLQVMHMTKSYRILDLIKLYHYK